MFGVRFHHVYLLKDFNGFKRRLKKRWKGICNVFAESCMIRGLSSFCPDDRGFVTFGCYMDSVLTINKNLLRVWYKYGVVSVCVLITEGILGGKRWDN